VGREEVKEHTKISKMFFLFSNLFKIWTQTNRRGEKHTHFFFRTQNQKKKEEKEVEKKT